MSKTITLADAKQAGIILPGHYVKVTAPKDRKITVTEKETGLREMQKFTTGEGEETLWRVDDDFKLWGNPTKEELALFGPEGFEHGPDTMHRVIRELYDIPDIFEEAKACSLIKEDYFFSSIENAYREEEKFSYPYDILMGYWLASRYVNVDVGIAHFYVFFAKNGYVNAEKVYLSYGYAYRYAHVVRPEATPKSTLLLERDGCDGSREKPWKCLSK